MQSNYQLKQRPDVGGDNMMAVHFSKLKSAYNAAIAYGCRVVNFKFTGCG